MKDYNLVIQIASPGIVDKLDARAKYNSVLFVDYSPIVQEIFYSFNSDKDFNRFRYSLYTTCQDFVKISKYSNGYRLNSGEIYVSPNMLAICLPREIRRKYFRRDNFYERRILKQDLNTHLL